VAKSILILCKSVNVCSCKYADKDKDHACDPDPCQRPSGYPGAAWQNRMNDPQQAANGKAGASENPMFDIFLEYVLDTDFNDFTLSNLFLCDNEYKVSHEACVISSEIFSL